MAKAGTENTAVEAGRRFCGMVGGTGHWRVFRLGKNVSPDAADESGENLIIRARAVNTLRDVTGVGGRSIACGSPERFCFPGTGAIRSASGQSI